MWSITRKERTEMTPPSRGESQEREGQGGEGPFKTRTVTSTERVQIVQMPMELTEASAEQLRMLSLSPNTEASREVRQADCKILIKNWFFQVCSTTTMIEAGAVPMIGGVTTEGVNFLNLFFKLNFLKSTLIF